MTWTAARPLFVEPTSSRSNNPRSDRVRRSETETPEICDSRAEVCDNVPVVSTSHSQSRDPPSKSSRSKLTVWRSAAASNSARQRLRNDAQRYTTPTHRILM